MGPQDTYHKEMSDFVPQNAANALVAVGSNHSANIADVAEILRKASSELVARGAVIRSQSRLFETPCFPAGAGPDFVNGVIVVADVVDPAAFLARLHDVEKEFGRERKVRWGQRILDLDLIGWGNRVLPDRDTVQRWMDLPLEKQADVAPDHLILPHPRMQDRAFVLVPLMDVAPDWIHPVTGLSVRQMHNALSQEARDAVKPLDKLGIRA